MSTSRTAPAAHRWLIVAVMLVAELMDLLDSTIVNVAGPSLKRSLGATPTGLQWVIGGYSLTLGAGLVLGGRLGDRYGRRRMFLVGLSAFTAASLLCALAPTVGALIACRLVQGAAGAMLLPQGLGLLRENFSGPELGRAFGLFGPVLGLGGIIGPVLGGGLIQADLLGLGWRLVFLVNLPIGLAALFVAGRFLPRTPGEGGVRVDLAGAALVAGASALLVLPLEQGQADGWPLWTWLSLAAAAAGYLLFVLQQRRTAARGRLPLVTPAMFRLPAFTVGLAGIALFFSGMIGGQLVLTLFLQLGQGYSAGAAGLGNLPLAVGTAIGGGIGAAVLAGRLGRTALRAGALLQVGGAALLWVELDHLGAPFSIWRIAPGVALGGVGSGIIVAALFSVVLAAVADEEVGSASGVLSAVQAIGGSVGVAVFGSVFFARVERGNAGDGFQAALLVQGGLLLAFLLLSAFLPRRARPEGEHADAGATPVRAGNATS